MLLANLIDLVAKQLNDRLKLTGVVYCMYESGTFRLAAEVAPRRRPVLQHDPAAPDPLGRGPHVPNPHPAQHSPGRGSQLWPVDLPLRTWLERGRGLRAVGPRSGRGLKRPASKVALRLRAAGLRPPLFCRALAWPSSGYDALAWRAPSVGFSLAGGPLTVAIGRFSPAGLMVLAVTCLRARQIVMRGTS